MAFPARFELTASGLGILRSIRLSYGNMQIDLRKYTTEGILFFTFCLVFSKVGFYLEWVKFPRSKRRGISKVSLHHSCRGSQASSAHHS